MIKGGSRVSFSIRGTSEATIARYMCLQGMLQLHYSMAAWGMTCADLHWLWKETAQSLSAQVPTPTTVFILWRFSYTTAAHHSCTPQLQFIPVDTVWCCLQIAAQPVTGVGISGSWPSSVSQFVQTTVRVTLNTSACSHWGQVSESELHKGVAILSVQPHHPSCAHPAL